MYIIYTTFSTSSYLKINNELFLLGCLCFPELEYYYELVD